MGHSSNVIRSDAFHVKPGKKIKLTKFATRYKGKELTKGQSEKLLKHGIKKLARMQDILYAHNQYSVLIILQAMDAAGKDGAIKHIMSGFNPLGVKVYNFKAPNSNELDHDFFWRHSLALPARGEIAIHNRSHYENVLVTRVHPEYVLGENIPGIDSVKAINEAFWEDRFKQIKRYEKNLADNGMVVIKFFLHVSKGEQKRRFMERIDDPAKNWKFSMADMKERGFWDSYQKAYEAAISATAEKHAPWFIIPADDKWYARLVMASIISEQFDKMKLKYPKASKEQLASLQKARVVLTGEGGASKKQKSKKDPISG
jgi:PPK2 family polyphosphate:nucleotide phosphotransferase